MYQLKFSIKTLSPVVISAASNSTLMTGSHDEISGSIIRGFLANKYIQAKNLGNTAHTDKDFLQLFYGDLKFLSATPAINAKRSYILPLSLQRGKKGTADEKNIKDLLTSTEDLKGYKSLRGYGVVDGDRISTASVKKNIFMHMSRSADGERISGKSEEGHIYNYEALEEVQIFCGAILGEKAALDKLVKALNLKNKFVDSIGRSRFTQYGKCEFKFDAVEEIKTSDFGEKIYLRLESPLVPAEDNFIGVEKILQTEVIAKLGEGFKLGKIFASGTEIENFISVWGMKSPRVMALAAGTVFEVVAPKNLSDPDKENLREKIYNGFGIRTEEGFGQLRLWTPQDFTVEKIKEDELSRPDFSDETLEIARKILLEKFLEQLRIYAHEDAEKLKLPSGNFTHFFSRLDNILSSVGKKDVRKKFGAAVSEASKDGSIFQDNLQKIYMDNQKLYDVLTGTAKLPYEDKEILSGTKEICQEIKFEIENFADEFCFEYLQNYFRTARKIAATKGGDNND